MPAKSAQPYCLRSTVVHWSFMSISVHLLFWYSGPGIVCKISIIPNCKLIVSTPRFEQKCEINRPLKVLSAKKYKAYMVWALVLPAAVFLQDTSLLQYLRNCLNSLVPRPHLREKVWRHPGFINFLERNISPPITFQKRQSVVQHRKFLASSAQWHSTFSACKLVIGSQLYIQQAMNF